MGMSWRRGAETGAFVLSQMLSREVSQDDKFSPYQVFVQRVLATSASTTSIVFVLVAMYFFLAIDPRRLVFRHQLIFFLLFFDLLKASILLLYPTRVLTHYTAYYNERFCQVVGFFTATAIEGADIAILAFAVHTFLLIFKPSLTTKVQGTDRTEGGLYRYRYTVYLLSFIIPLVISSLAYIGRRGYISYVCWCYLPETPVWYRLVLSWAPRYVILILILTVYCYIYFHVMREFRTLGGVFTTIHKANMSHRLEASNSNQKPGLYSALKYFLQSVREFISPKLMLPESNDSVDEEEENKEQNSSSNAETSTYEGNSAPNDPELHVTNLANFRKRQRIIEKQMTSIFVYPFAYCFAWFFPFILQITQFNSATRRDPIYWLNCMGAFMQPLNGFIDTLVFFFRERPWDYTIMKSFEREYGSQMEQMRMNEIDDESSGETYRQKNHSWSAGIGVDINDYSKWRRKLSDLNLPFMKLPTEENIAKLQARHFSKAGNAHTITDKSSNMNLTSKHDFSNILSGDLAEQEFRSTLESFSFSNNKRPSVASSTTATGGIPRKGSIISSGKSVRSRQMSMEPTSQTIYEGVSAQQSTANHKPSTVEPESPFSNKKSTANNTISTSWDSELDDEMDFMEFLRKGP